MKSKTITICGLEELSDFADELVHDFLGDYKKVLFYGEMGAGKTTFIKMLCKALGVETVTASPTFALVHQYPIKNSPLLIHHADLYRLEQAKEAFDIGIEELFYDENYFFVEWPELLEQFIPIKVLYIKIDTINEDCRRFEIKVV